MRAKWPSPQDFNEAIQNPNTCFADTSLRNGTVALNSLGLPRVESGNFANVYKVTCPDATFAVRCFTHQVADVAARYGLLSDFILNDDLIYTVTFHFQEQGIRVGKDWFPIVKMEWVDGDHFIPWIERNVEHPQNFIKLADNFLSMMSDLQQARIAHGDLQHGNIIIVDNDFRLVDYDGMFVPGMAGMTSNELGHSNYQHPRRDKSHFGSYLDNFSAWLIFASLEMIARDSSLWHDIGKKDGETILFTASDLSSPENSLTFRRLREHTDKDIRLAANSILDLLHLRPEQVPPPAVTHRNLRFTPLRSPSWVEKLSRRAERMVRLLSPKANKQPTAPPPGPISNSSAQRQLPNWLEDWIAKTPLTAPPREGSSTSSSRKQSDKPSNAAPSNAAPSNAGSSSAGASTPSLSPLRSAPPQHAPSQQGEPKLHGYDISRMLARASKLASGGKLGEAKRLIREAQDAAKSGGYPALILETLSAEAAVMAMEASAHRHAHRFHEATSLYEKAIRALRQCRQLRSGKPDRLDDLTESHYLVALATIHQQHGRDLAAVDALHEAIALLSRHPNTKADIARIQKLLPPGHN